AIADTHRLVDTGGSPRLDNDKDRWIGREELLVDGDHRRGKGAHAGLQEDVARAGVAERGKLFLRLRQQRRITLHHPHGDLLVAGPRGIRDDLPAVRLGVAVALAHGIVIVAVYHTHLGAKLGDGVDARLR